MLLHGSNYTIHHETDRRMTANDTDSNLLSRFMAETRPRTTTARNELSSQRGGVLESIMMNLNIIQETWSSPQQVATAWKEIEELIPQLVAAQLHLHIFWPNKEIQRLIHQASRSLRDGRGDHDAASGCTGCHCNN